MGLIETGLKYRKITLMIFVILIIAGVSGFLTMPRYEDPQFKIYTAQVLTVYPGATGEQIEVLVTKPLEEKIAELKDVQNIYSSSQGGVSSIFVELSKEADREKSWEDLRRKVNEARALLPSGVEEPEVNDELNRTNSLIMHLLAPPGKPVTALRQIAEDWQDALQQVPGVEKVAVVGLPDEQVQIILDPAALAARQLSWLHMADALQKRNVSIPGGTLREGQMGLLVESSGEYRSLQEIEQTVIYQPSGGAAVKVRDVARVELAPARTEALVEAAGRPGVAITVMVKEGRSIFTVDGDVNRRVQELVQDLPPGVEMVTVFNQAASVSDKFKELQREMFTGVCVVLFICILGLHWRTAMLVALAIPTSVAVGFVVLSGMGLDMHQITIASLILALGILVDDAIVVNDNIERHLALGQERYAAVLNGTREVAVSIITATVATVASFLPLLLLRGDIGGFIRALPLVVAVTMLASMVVSLWLVPIVRYWLAGPGRRDNDRQPTAVVGVGQAVGRTGWLGPVLDRFSVWYEARLAATLRRPWLTVAAALCFSTGALALLPYMGVQFFPYAERPEFVIDIATPKGSSLYETAAVAREVAGAVAEKEGVEQVFTYVGDTIPKFYYNEVTIGGAGETNAQLLVVAAGQDTRRVHALVGELRDQLTGAFPGTMVTIRELEQGPVVGAPVAIRVYGDDIAKLRALADQVSGILSQIPGAINVADDVGPDNYIIKVNSSSELTSRWGVAEKDIASSVRMAVDGLKISDYRMGDRLCDVVLRTGQADLTGLADIGALWVPAWKTGAVLPLTQVASVDADWTTGIIHRRNLERVITVRAYTDGVLPSDIIKQAAGAIDTIALPIGYWIEYGGETEERNAAFTSIGRLFIVVVLLIYLIIAMQFYSLTKPAIVMLSVYLSLSGAVLGLYITGTPVGFMALMGAVSLAGIVVRNGIVLIDFIEGGLRQGVPLGDAIRQAGKVRLRPILLTSFTAVGALLPMVFMGSSLWRPMAISIISGLLFSTVLTLVVVPNVYLLVARFRKTPQTVGAIREAGLSEQAHT